MPKKTPPKKPGQGSPTKGSGAGAATASVTPPKKAANVKSGSGTDDEEEGAELKVQSTAHNEAAAEEGDEDEEEDYVSANQSPPATKSASAMTAEETAAENKAKTSKNKAKGSATTAAAAGASAGGEEDEELTILHTIIAGSTQTAATHAEPEPVMPTAAGVGNEIITKHLNEALGDSEKYDWEALRTDPDWVNRHVKRGKASKFKSISEGSADEWSREITHELEFRMQLYIQALQSRSGAASTGASPAPGMGGATKTKRETRSLSNMLREGAQLMKTYENNKLTDPADLHRFSAFLSGDYPVPDYENPNTDRIYEEKLDSPYCNVPSGRNAFKSPARAKLHDSISEICPFYPELADGTAAPHDYFQQTKNKAFKHALVNLRHWKKMQLPLQVVLAVQAQLQQTFGIKVCRPFLTILLAEEVTNLRTKQKGASKLKRSKEEEGVSTKRSRTDTGSKKTKGAAAAAASSSKSAAAAASSTKKAGAGKSSAGKRKVAAVESEEEEEEGESGEESGLESGSGMESGNEEAEVWVDVDEPENRVGEGDDFSDDERLPLPAKVKEPTVESAELYNDRLVQAVEDAVKKNPKVDLSTIKVGLCAKNYLLEIHRVFGCPPDTYNTLKAQLSCVKPADAWAGLKTAMTPLQYKTFYILANDGSTPAAKVVVLAGQQDKINVHKLTVSVVEGHKIIGYDSETRSDAFENCLTKGIGAKVVNKFLVPKKCVIGLVTPVYGPDDQEISLKYMQQLKSDSLWLHRPANEVVVNPFIGGYDPLSATGPKADEKHMWQHSPERLDQAYYNFLFYHIEDYEKSFRWAATEPLPVPFTIPEKFLYPAEHFDWALDSWVHPKTKKQLDYPEPEWALEQDKMIKKAAAPSSAAAAAAAAASSSKAASSGTAK